MDMTDTIVPRSDQLNAEDMLTAPVTVTVTAVRRGSTEQPVEIVTAEFGDGRPFKPSKTVRRILVAAWGAEATEYIGRRMTLYRDPTIKFGGMDVGGIRVSHMSHIDKQFTINLTATRGKRAPHTVKPLADAPPPAPAGKPLDQQITAVVGAFNSLNVFAVQLEQKVGRSHEAWTVADVASLTALGKRIKSGDTTVEAEFAAEGGADQ